MYRFEFVPGAVLLAAVVVLPLAPAFAMIALLVVALVAVAALVALAGLLVATPYLVVRGVRRHVAARHEATDGSAPITTAVPQPS